MGKATIYSIARSLDISPSTVSRAFTRPELVKDDVRAQILEMAEQVKYRPNKSARGLATGRTGTIGLFVSDITNPFFPPLVRAVQKAASSDASVLLIDGDQSAADEPSLLSGLAAQVDGLIVASPRSSSARLKKAIGDTPCVIVNRVIAGEFAVTVNNARALEQAGEHLKKFGHQKIALLRGPEGSWAAQRRSDAVRRWSRQAGVELLDLGVFEDSYDGGWVGGQVFADSDATAAFAFDDVTACGVIAALHEKGIAVPDDRSVVGCDGVLISALLTPSLTTVTAPIDELGSAAVRMLAESSASVKPDVLGVAGVFTPRQSTGPVSR